MAPFCQELCLLVAIDRKVVEALQSIEAEIGQVWRNADAVVVM